MEINKISLSSLSKKQQSIINDFLENRSLEPNDISYFSFNNIIYWIISFTSPFLHVKNFINGYILLENNKCSSYHELNDKFPLTKNQEFTYLSNNKLIAGIDTQHYINENQSDEERINEIHQVFQNWISSYLLKS